MDIQLLKIELAKRILEIDSADVIQKLYRVLGKEDKGFWLGLTDVQKKEIELGLRQISDGETEEWSTFIKRVS